MPPIKMGKGPVAIFPPNKSKSFLTKLARQLRLKMKNYQKIFGPFQELWPRFMSY